MSFITCWALCACSSIAFAQKVTHEQVHVELGAARMAVKHEDRLMRKESMKDISEHRDVPTAVQGPLVGVEDVGTQDPYEPTAPPPVIELVTTTTTTNLRLATASPAYNTAIFASRPAGFWTLANVGNALCPGRPDSLDITNGCGDNCRRTCGLGLGCGSNAGLVDGQSYETGDPCLIDAQVNGITTAARGLVPSNTAEGAMRFSGAANEKVLIPESTVLNTKSDGYRGRTVELWFEPTVTPASPGTTPKVIFSEGNKNEAGLNMYVKEDPTTLKMYLYMFAWDRDNSDHEFGTTLVATHPIKCEIQKDRVWYAAAVFDSNNGTSPGTFTGWIRRGYNSTDYETNMHRCGTATPLPIGVDLARTGNSKGKCTIGGFQMSSRQDGSDEGMLEGDDHNFVGVVDDVAIYDRALDKAELELHYAAATAPTAATTESSLQLLQLHSSSNSSYTVVSRSKQ